uniref:Uncharacterized protein n=1 Tax=Glossina palpalis gambiensis TaxID=67801 RepID=A0A1B0AQD9_9MUSC
MTMWQSGGMGGGGHGSQNNPWMKLMGIVHKERRHTDNITSQSGSNERNLNQYNCNFGVSCLAMKERNIY